MHRLGRGGLGVDHAAAARLYAAAATQGHASAQFKLALCYLKGEGEPLNLAESARLMLLSAEQGFAISQAQVAAGFLDGIDGFGQDYSAALLWARRAAVQKDDFGKYLLGRIYREGHGVPVDLRAAASWGARSAARSFDPAMVQLRDLAVEGVREASAALYRLGEDAPLRAEDAAAAAAGRCPLGDLAAQQAAVDSWGRRSLADVRAAAFLVV
jgi:TPR repeat protein